MEPDWVRHCVWWQIYPLGFTGAEPAALMPGTPPLHRLRRIIDWMDYAVELGVSGIALGPVFASETHGYDTTDYLRLDPRLGDDDDFDELVAEAHDRGLRVLLDGVFNHVGRSFEPFRRAVAGGPGTSTASWFRFSQEWAAGEEPGYADFEGHHHLVALNHEEPAVADFVAGVMKHWLSRGVDGWRLDAAYAVPPAFWARVLGDVRATYPDAYFVGEYIHGDYAGAVAAAHLDSATQYELWKAVWSSLNDGNYFELAAALERHNGFLAEFVPLTFVGNHDVTRIASKLDDPQLLPLALVLLFTVGGTPSIYYGDEQAFRGIKEERIGGDDAVRPAFPDAPAELAGVGWPIYRLHEELIGIRRRSPWLHGARTTVLVLSNLHLVYRVTDGSTALLVALNMSLTTVDVEVPPMERVLAGPGSLADGGHRLVLPPRGWAVLG